MKRKEAIARLWNTFSEEVFLRERYCGWYAYDIQDLRALLALSFTNDRRTRGWIQRISEVNTCFTSSVKRTEENAKEYDKLEKELATVKRRFPDAFK